MESPKISVIIPNYNHGNYLRQRIETVLNQTYKNFEVIILDDCSTDNSREIIKDYDRHPLIKHIVFNDLNTGNPFKQWQKGVDLATGEWIWIAESDDYADSHFLKIMLTALDNHKDIGLIYCDSNIVTPTGVALKTFASIKNERFNTTRWSEDYLNNGSDEIENYLLKESTINNTSAVLFNKLIFTNVDPFDITFKYIGDKYIFTKVLANSKVLYVKENLNFYRDPFNTKHKEKYLFYFYEQFLVFNWVSKNLKLIDLKKFNLAFYQSTTFSMYTHWSKKKLFMLKNLFFLNPWLFIKCMIYNLKRPIFK